MAIVTAANIVKSAHYLAKIEKVWNQEEPMDLQAAIIDKIERERKKRGMSQYKLAILAGVPVSTVKNVLSKKSQNPRSDTLWHMMEGLDFTAYEFFSDPVFEGLRSRD